MDQGDIGLSDKEFQRIKERVYGLAGISMSDAKRTLIVSRLMKIVRGLGLQSFDSYLDFLESDKSTRDDQQSFVNALTTNLTRFYREDHHFDHLVEYVGKLIATKRPGPTGRPRLRIWSAGCSTGQEPYTIAMALLSRYPELKRWDFRILATDIDTLVLEKAAKGIYQEGDLAGLSPQRMSVFEKAGDGTVRIPAAMRELIAFKPLNLHGNWPMSGPFDAIFCRNVAIYFDKPTQKQLFDRLGDILAPGGFLYIGHSESIASGSGKFSLVGKTIYKTPPATTSRDAA